MAKTNKVTHPLPDLAKTAYAAASETYQTQIAIARGDYSKVISRLTEQVLEHLHLDGTKKDYIVDFEKGVVEEYPLGAKIKRQPQAPANPVAGGRKAKAT